MSEDDGEGSWLAGGSTHRDRWIDDGNLEPAKELRGSWDPELQPGEVWEREER